MYQLIRADIFAGAGYVVPVWAQILRKHGLVVSRPNAKAASYFTEGADAEYYLALDQATYRFMTRPTASTPIWPTILSTDDLLRATSDGFDLVTTFVGKFGDSPIYALRRQSDGQIAPPGWMKQPVAHDARHKYFGHGMPLQNGTVLYKRKAGA
jgi:hypothetical protein